MKIDKNGEQGLFIDFDKFRERVSGRRDSGEWITDGKITKMPSYQEIVRDFPDVIARDIDEQYDKHIFFSHRWDGEKEGDPPDPRGWQLEAIHAYASELKVQGKKACFWYDYSSLPQKPRTPEEDKIFDKGLKHINHLCQTCTTVPLISSVESNRTLDIHAMLKRGWILAELYLASKDNRIDHPLFEGTEYITFSKLTRLQWQDIVPDLKNSMPHDSPEAIHAYFVENGVKCTNGSDLEFLADILHKDLNSVETKAAPPVKLEFDKTVTMDAQQAYQYKINQNGLSPHFPDTYFEFDSIEGSTDYQVTPRYRPVLPELNDVQHITKEEFSAFRIDKESGRSEMYPGIRFEWKRAASNNKFEIKAVLEEPRL